MQARILTVTIILAGAWFTPTAPAEGMFCEPGENWQTVAEGEIADDGWSVVNFTKPMGGEIRLDWWFEGYDQGPSSAGFWFGPEAEEFKTGLLIETSESQTGATLEVADEELDTRDSATLQTSSSEGSKHAILTLGAYYSGEEMHALQYGAGKPSNRTISWELSVDHCLDPSDVRWGDASGSEAELVTANDMDGTLTADARTGTGSVFGTDGGSALLDASFQRYVEDTPYLHVYWASDSSDIDLDGPGGYAFQNMPCFDGYWATACAGWGNESYGEPATEGTYEFSVTGFTDPTQGPRAGTTGPYFVLASTVLPSQDHQGAQG